ncbi:MAG: WD40 repeat domain-containing protein, partial [bacterium]
MAVCFVLLIALAGFAISTILYFQAETAREEADRQKISAQKESYRANLSAADMQLSSNNVDTAQEFLDRCEPELRNWEWWHLFYRSDSSEMELAAYTGVSYFPNLATTFTFDPSGDRVWWNSETAIHSWDLQTGLPLESWGGFDLILAVSPDVSRVLCTKDYWEEGELSVFDTNSGAVVSVLTGLNSAAACGRFSPDGKQIAVGGGDGRIRVWEAENRKVRLKLDGHKGLVEALTFSLDGRLIASGSADSTVRIWETEGGELRHIMRGHGSGVSSLSFNPNQTLLASASDKTVRIWEVRNGELRRTFNGHQGPVWCVAFSPDGSLLATASQDRTIR